MRERKKNRDNFLYWSNEKDYYNIRNNEVIYSNQNN